MSPAEPVSERTEALRDLVELRKPIPAAISALRRFAWDSDAALVTLTGRDLIRTLEGYLRGQLSAIEVEEWAEAIEGRDDIGYEPQRGDVLRLAIFELANPLLATPLDSALARRWLEAAG